MKRFFTTLIFLFPLAAPLYLQAQCERASIVDDYVLNFQGSSVTTAELAWTGNTTSCDAGTISALAHQRTLDRINYFRRLCGVADNIVFRRDLDSLCQEAALMMKAQGGLSHSPDTSWACYSVGGKNAAGSSNLSLGSHSANAMVAYMRDAGAGNVAAGHRRWILYSRASIFGHGSTNSTSALWVTGNRVSQPPIDFIAYPAESFFPAPLVFPRWSFSVPGADFANATVTMTDPSGANIPLNIVYTNGGYGDRSIVWEPDMSMIDLINPLDLTYHIEIQGVLASPSANYAYDVVIIQPSHPPACAMGSHWNEDSCSCLLDNAAIGNLLAEDQLKMHFDPANEQLQLAFPQSFQGNTRLQIISMEGKVVKQLNWENLRQGGEANVSLQGLASGVYAIEVRQGNAYRIMKVMK